ncbi:MAG: helix-turn-helix domain-containing protein [Clostridia bacterium]|nr:helix-turn-helix domain-containing protein [Clostridia bacterium]
MDQMTTGKFIAERRKARGLTQRELADLLNISDKTVSKWERGGGLPEVSLMLPLCKELDISVNELLSGRKLSDSEYKQNAEDNILSLIEEQKVKTKFQTIIAVIVVGITLLAGVTIIMLAGHLELKTVTRILLIALSFIIILVGIGVAIALEITCGAFECRKCGHRFVPTVGAYLIGAHTATTRYLKCPKCSKRSWCSRKMSLLKKENEQENNQED